MAAATAATIAPFVPFGNNVAHAAENISCRTSASVMGVQQDGDLYLYPHEEPETGAASWGQKKTIGNGWHQGRTLAGPNGWMWSLRADGNQGDLRRYRWNGNGWDTFADGLQYETVGSGWARYTQPEHRNKVTVDQNGHIYEINPEGKLKLFRWDDAKKNWINGTGDIIDTGWDQYDMIVGAGDGVLYARKPNGELYRFRYDVASQRWIQYQKGPWHGWHAFKHVSSPGGDVLYATWVNPKTGGGELLWYRYHEDTNTWDDDKTTGVGRLVGTGWHHEFDVVATTNDCKLTTTATPQRPAVPASLPARNALLQGDNGLMRYALVQDNGTLTYGRQRSAADPRIIDWSGMTGYHEFTGVPGLVQHSDGTTELFGHAQAGQHASDVLAYRETSNNSFSFRPVANLGGAMLSDPVVMRDKNKLHTAFAVDADGKLWHRTQYAENSPFLGWKQSGSENLTPDFSVVLGPDGQTFYFAARAKDGTVRVFLFSDGKSGSGRSVGSMATTGRPAILVQRLSSQLPIDSLRLFARGVDGKVYNHQGNMVLGFQGPWGAVGDLKIAGSPSAVLTNTGGVEIVARRSTDNVVFQTGLTSPDSGTFREWKPFNGGPESDTDLAMLNGANNTLWVTWRVGPEFQVWTAGYGASAAVQNAPAPRSLDARADQPQEPNYQQVHRGKLPKS
ncbi:tachylectin-related carbohydrate-binding protein [Streptoalloteichus hindustanus]|uniref:Tachylectin n=1 Tax=Streptoalloteichus hindustanus TaxID=2017 RepID=A0A1M5KVZ9_STRHI|nr:tachylectin-related carbohydrate-binding protein [Streptoalloteichus hindustanus]SHG56343.1 Tachylectin [Streptoalloteichus hindustanus]